MAKNFNLFLLASVVILASGLIIILSAIKTPQRWTSEAKVCESCDPYKPFCDGQYLLKCKDGCVRETNCGKDGCGTDGNKNQVCCNQGGYASCPDVYKSDQCAKVGLKGASRICYNKNATAGGGTCGSVFYCCAEGQKWTHADKTCCLASRVYNADSVYQVNDTFCCSHDLVGGKCL